MKKAKLRELLKEREKEVTKEVVVNEIVEEKPKRTRKTKGDK